MPLTSKQVGRVAWTCFLAAGLILILTAVLESRACADTLDGLVITSAAVDLATTEWALGQPGMHEANPLLQGPPERALVKTAATVAVVAGGRYLERHGHRNWSRGVRIGIVVLWSGAAVNNAIRARRKP